MKSYLTTNGLMRHLRDSGVNINGSYQKKQLINYGYYHGYKGYRFFASPTKMIPFTDFNQLIAVINYDNSLKSLFYQHLMFIETSLKNITLNIILEEAASNQLTDIFNKLMPGYFNAPVGTNEDNRKKIQKKKLNLQKKIRDSLLQSYLSKNKIVTHFYHSGKYEDVPIWAVFEILNLGNFGSFVSCLNKSTREKISRYIDLDLSGDTDRRLLEKMIFVIKDLRNAVAHNDIVFDTRFKNTGINQPLQVCLTHEIGLPYANFKAIIDYIILVSYILEKLNVSKREIQKLISLFERSLNELQKDVGNQIYSMIVHVETLKKLNLLKVYIKN